MKANHSVVKRPLVTEKATALQERQKTYCFEVELGANKIEIRSAIERLFGVKVADVRTCVMRGKSRRFGRAIGRRSNWKKAYVRLAGDESLDILNTVQS